MHNENANPDLKNIIPFQKELSGMAGSRSVAGTG